MFRRHPLALLLIVTAYVVAAAGTGCQKEAPPQVQSAAALATPKESFEEIARRVKEGIELRDATQVFSALDEKTSSRIQVHNEVTSQLIPPANPDDPYRGTITVTSRSIYSLRKSAEEQADEEKSKQDSGFSLLDDEEESDSGFDVIDTKLITASPAGDKPDAAVESVQRRADEYVRTYDLAYENGRWVLKTALNPETEKSIQNAFDRALRLQP